MLPKGMSANSAIRKIWKIYSEIIKFAHEKIFRAYGRNGASFYRSVNMSQQRRMLLLCYLV